MRQPLLAVHTTNTPLPAQVDVAVIGAGAAGIATAYELAKLGKRVGVFEKGRVAAEQSSRNWGWCRTLGRDMRELEMARLSIQRWAELSGQADADLGFRATGVTFLTRSQQELAAWEHWRDAARRMGVRTEMLPGAAANRLYPAADGPWLGGIRAPDDGYAEPARSIPMLAQHALKLGVSIHQDCAVNDLDYQAGSLTGIVTEQGGVRADAVVIAAGAWSSLFCLKQKVVLPTLNVYSSTSKTQAMTALAQSGPLRTPAFSLRARDDGGYTLAKSGRGIVPIVPNSLRYGWRFKSLYAHRKHNVTLQWGKAFFQQLYDELGYLYLGRSPFTRTRIWDPVPNEAIVQSAYAAIAQTFPDLGQARLETAWAGVIDNTPDGIPVVSACTNIPGLYLCTGFSGHGFGSALGAGRMLATLIASGQAPVGLAQLSHARFLSGQALTPSIIY